MTSHKIGTRQEWAAAREQLLAREKEHTRLGDELARQRRELPWVAVEKDYHPDGPGSAAAGPSQPAPSGRATAATVAAYAAAAAALSNALVSAYWALGGRGLISTVGGYVTQFAHQKGAAPVLLALGAAAAKAAGGLLALALVRPWGRVIPRRWLLAGSAGASALLVVYGGLYVLLGALVLSGAIHPAGSVDRTALRWHVGVWDLWFLVWGILLALATAGYRRRTVTGRRDHRRGVTGAGAAGGAGCPWGWSFACDRAGGAAVAGWS